MFKKMLSVACLLSLCVLGGCGEDSSDNGGVNGGGNGDGAGNGNQGCQCENSNCMNCATEVSSCEDDTHIKIVTKIDGYDGGRHVVRNESNTKPCTTGLCTADNTSGAHCGDSDSSGNCFCEDEVCNNCSKVIKTECVNGLGIGRLDVTVVIDGYTDLGKHITNTSLIGTDCKKQCVQDTETTAHCIEDEASGDSGSTCQCDDFECLNCAEVTRTACQMDPNDGQIKLAKYVTIHGFYGMINLTKNTIILEECELGTTCQTKSEEAVCE